MKNSFFFSPSTNKTIPSTNLSESSNDKVNKITSLIINKSKSCQISEIIKILPSNNTHELFELKTWKLLNSIYSLNPSSFLEKLKIIKNWLREYKNKFTQIETNNFQKISLSLNYKNKKVFCELVEGLEDEFGLILQGLVFGRVSGDCSFDEEFYCIVCSLIYSYESENSENVALNDENVAKNDNREDNLDTTDDSLLNSFQTEYSKLEAKYPNESKSLFRKFQKYIFLGKELEFYENYNSVYKNNLFEFNLFLSHVLILFHDLFTQTNSLIYDDYLKSFCLDLIQLKKIKMLKLFLTCLNSFEFYLDLCFELFRQHLILIEDDVMDGIFFRIRKEDFSESLEKKIEFCKFMKNEMQLVYTTFLLRHFLLNNKLELFKQLISLDLINLEKIGKKDNLYNYINEYSQYKLYYNYLLDKSRLKDCLFCLDKGLWLEQDLNYKTSSEYDINDRIDEINKVREMYLVNMIREYCFSLSEIGEMEEFLCKCGDEQLELRRWFNSDDQFLDLVVYVLKRVEEVRVNSSVRDGEY